MLVERSRRSCRSRTPRRSKRGIDASANAMPNEVLAELAPGAVAFRPRPASRSAAAAPRSAAPPTAPAAPRPDSKERHTPAVTRSDAAVPTAPATGGGGGNGATQGSAHPAGDAGRKTTAPSASHAARSGAHATAGAMTRERPLAAACAAGSPRSAACRAAAGVSRWRRSAFLPNVRASSAGNGISGGAQEANVWIARRLFVAPPAVSDARTVPTPALLSVTSYRCGRRRSP